MKIATIQELPFIFSIWEETGSSTSITHYEQLKLATRVFLSDSGDSYCSFYRMHDGKYHMHVGSKRGRAKEFIKLLMDALHHMFNFEDAEVIIGFVKHKGLRFLLGTQIPEGTIPIIKVSPKERMYVITKENIKEAKRCLMVE